MRIYLLDCPHMVPYASYRLLGCFLGQDQRHFAELCKQAGYPTDLGGYYLRQLVQGGYLTKGRRGEYSVTAKGKQELALAYGARMRTRWPRPNILLVTEQAGRFVVLHRTVQPYIGRAEWPAGAVQMGEPLAVAARRLLQERLGVAGEPRLKGFFRRIDLYEQTVFDDKLFAVHTIAMPTSTPIAVSAGTGSTALYTPQELRQLPGQSRSLLDIFAFVRAPGTQYEEHQYELGPDDLLLPKETTK